MTPKDLRVDDHPDTWYVLADQALETGTFAEGEVDGIPVIAVADVYVIEHLVQGLSLPECPVIERTEDKRRVYCLRLPEDWGQQ